MLREGTVVVLLVPPRFRSLKRDKPVGVRLDAVPPGKDLHRMDLQGQRGTRFQSGPGHFLLLQQPLIYFFYKGFRGIIPGSNTAVLECCQERTCQESVFFECPFLLVITINL